MFFLPVQVEQLLDHRRDSSLLRPDIGVSSVHDNLSKPGCVEGHQQVPIPYSGVKIDAKLRDALNSWGNANQCIAPKAT